MPIMEISLIPIGTRNTSISKYVVAGEKAFNKADGFKKVITAMGTIVEAESLHKLFAVAEEMHNKAMAAGAKRVLTHISIDDRKDKKVSMASKVESVLKKGISL